MSRVRFCAAVGPREEDVIEHFRELFQWKMECCHCGATVLLGQSVVTTVMEQCFDSQLCPVTICDVCELEVPSRKRIGVDGTEVVQGIARITAERN